MPKKTKQPTMTNVLKAAIRDSGKTPYRISKDTGIVVTSILRFLDGETSLRLDKADVLAAYLGLRIVTDPKAQKPQPTPEHLARPMLAKRSTRRKSK